MFPSARWISRVNGEGWSRARCCRATAEEAVAHAEIRKKKAPKRTLALPDLEHAKSAVVNSLSSASGQRTYTHAIDDFVGWYCSEPRLAFNGTVVLRYRIHLE